MLSFADNDRTNNNLLVFTKRLSTLLENFYMEKDGLITALEILVSDNRIFSETFQKDLDKILQEAKKQQTKEKGVGLYSVLKEFPTIFPPFYLAIVEISADGYVVPQAPLKTLLSVAGFEKSL